MFGNTNSKLRVLQYTWRILEEENSKKTTSPKQRQVTRRLKIKAQCTTITISSSEDMLPSNLYKTSHDSNLKNHENHEDHTTKHTTNTF